MKTINFDLTVTDAKTIKAIVKRASALAVKQKSPLSPESKQTLEMDLAACHLNGTPLALQRLLEFPDPDFVHDLNGISKNINRATGQLNVLFVLRCAAQKRKHAIQTS